MLDLVINSCKQLSCVQDSQAPVILCLEDTVSLVSTGHIISAFLLTSEHVNDGCDSAQFWRYTISYDESLLTDPTTPLVSGDVKGLFCEDCLTDWVRELIAGTIS